MGNLADWFIPLAIGVVVVCVTFVVASRLLQRAKDGGDVVVPPSEETLNEEANVGSVRASDKTQGAKVMAWKQFPRGITTHVAVGVVAILLVFAGVSWLLKPRNLDCASKEARELVSQIASENGAMMENVASRFIQQNPLPPPPPPPKSAERIAAERAVAALEDASSKAEKEWNDFKVDHSSHDAFIRTFDIWTALSLRGSKARENARAARAALRVAYGPADDAAIAAARTAYNANHDAVLADVRKEMQYTLDAIRATDKNLSGALTCAATLKGDGGKYGAWTLPITYKVQETSDRKLYVGVYGLK
jgi:hypothetical protein